MGKYLVICSANYLIIKTNAMKKQFSPGRLLLTCFTLLGYSAIYAQTLSPTVIASTGAYATNANGSLSYTVGEMTMVQTFSAGNSTLTQGFQQPNDKVTGLLNVAESDEGSFIVYPNPAVDNLWYGYQFAQSGTITIDLYNALSQKLSTVFEGNYTGGKIVEQLNTSSLAAGTYFLNLHLTGANDGNAQLTTKKFLVIR
jgi:hypothetical protein